MKTLIAGTFDNFHVGHQWLIWQAYLPEFQISNFKFRIKEGSKITPNSQPRTPNLTIIVARDKTVQRIKGRAPKNSEEARLKRVEQEVEGHTNIKVQLGHPEGDFWQTIADVAPDRILLGYDQHVKEADILAHFPHIKTERCTAYQPEVFKSSKF